MKKLGLVVLVLLSMISINKVKASHLMGSDLTWTCVGQDSFMIKLVVYRDCNGITLGTSPINFKCATSGASITSLSIGVGTPVDITPVCNTSCTRCQSSGCSFPYGIHRYTMQGIVRLNNAGSCCSIAISWAQSARNAAITTITGGGSDDLYIEAQLNRCQNPCDNSPTFTNPPVAILCVGQDFTFNHGVQDLDVNSTGGLADSLTYEWTPPLKAAGSSCTYVGQYAYNRSIYFWGFPNETLPFPRGMHLDQQTGDIQFRPMKAEVTVMAIKVNEYRNGVKIAEIRRDLQIIVITCTSNNPPSVTTPNNVRSKQVCAGSPVSFNFTTSDPNPNDTVSISWNNSIPGAIWTHTNGASKHPTGTLTWTPTDAHVSSLPYTFTVTAKDNACPIRASYTQAFQITVKPNPQANIIVTDSGCGVFWFLAQRVLGSGPSYLWQGNNFVFQPSVGSVVWHKFTQPGLYPYTMTMTASGCSKSYFDTVEVDTFITNFLPRDTNLCYGASITLVSDVNYNQGAITMVWGSKGTVFNSDTDLTKTFTITKDTVIWSRASDTMGCTATDTIHINMHKQPEVDLGPDVSICSYGQADMKVTYKLDESGLRSISWTDLKTNNVVDNDTMLTSSDTSQYMCTVMDTFGCIGYDTIKLQKNPEVIASVMSAVICYGDEAVLVADVTGGGNAQYMWFEGTKLIGGARTLKVKPIATTDYWLKVQESKNGVTCKDSMMVRVRVNPLPVIKISAIDKRCVNGSIISLNSFVTVNGTPNSLGKWSSPSPGLIYGDKFNPVASGVSSPPGWKVKYEYIDPGTGCYNKDSSYVTIYALPKPYAGKDDSICTGAKLPLTGAPLLPPGTWRGIGVEGSYPNWKFNPDALGIINGGTYEAIYHYTDNNTCENEDTVKITVYKTPIVDAGNPKEFCVDANSITLTGDPAAGNWSGKGVASNIFYPSMAQAGVHDLTYTYTNVICTVIDKVKYTVWDLPVVTATTQSGRTDFCRTEGQIQLNGQPSGSGGIWSGPGIIGNNFNTAIGADAPTDYSLRYEYTDGHKCKNKADLMVKVRPEPVVVIDPNGAKLCFGEPYTIKATYDHADKLLWWQGTQSDGTILGPTDSSQIGYNPGMGDFSRLSFWLHIKATEKTNICPPAYDSIKVLMSAMPDPEFAGDPQSGCTPLSVQFTDLTTIQYGSVTNWEWTFGDGDMSGNKDPLHIYQRPGKYTVKLHVISDAGCEKEIVKSEYIESYVVPSANFIPKPSLALLSVPTIAFQNTTTNETPLIKYSWNFADWDKYEPGGGTSDKKSPIYKYSDTGHYNVRLIATNEFGCSDTAYREVVILEDVSVYTPNAFTPDNTGPKENDVFRVVPKGIESFELRIFDRWGQLMYESHDYETHGWPGTYLGSIEPAPMDVYIYVIKVKGLDGIDYKYSGSVSLLR